MAIDDTNEAETTTESGAAATAQGRTARKSNARTPKPPPEPDLNAPELYINRELSQLAFNRRVLEQARNPGTPLLERLRFLTICSTNMDEFFEIRVAGLKQQAAFGVTRTAADGLSPLKQLEAISEIAHELVDEQYRVLNEELLPQLEEAGIRISRRTDLVPRQEKWVKRYFSTQVQPVITPVGLDPSHPFPKLLNKSLNFIVTLEGRDAFGRNSGLAVVTVPRSLPRLIRLPKDISRGRFEFVMLSSVVHAHVKDLFPGMKVTGCYQFRVTRNSDLFVDEEEVDDLLHALQGELLSRRYGEAVRLEVADNCSKAAYRFLLRQFGLGEHDLYQVNGPVNLHRLSAVIDLVDLPDCKYQPFIPGIPRRVSRTASMFEVLRRGDVVLHHPFDSFAPVLDLMHQAAQDPDVLAIKCTLYRTAQESPVVRSLIQAASNGKEVTAVVELRARFDEEANIDWANRLQEAGANVVYGVVGYKCHSKMFLVVRREGRKLRRYTHLGTGNYHHKTAKLYTDVALLTAQREIGQDVHNLFTQLTGLGKATRMKRLHQSPFTLYKRLLELIEGEAERAAAGEEARIIAKMNSLQDPGIIQALYRASQAGVSIDLIVRGICCLRPGVPGVSENIRVRSIVGRFLEHSRVFWFLAGGEEVMFCASADWMIRNLHRRVEVAFPIDDPALKARLKKDTLDLYLADKVQAWQMQPDGSYKKPKPTARSRGVQIKLLEKYTEYEG